ncbi:MAG: endonuclease, partial [Rhodothermales bacterium]|nr:endonuclease [Rhodothermales bacterium]
LYVFNAHLDHVGEQSREESSRLIVDRIASHVGDDPFILLGDFNAEPDSRVYSIITSDSARIGLNDASAAAEIAYGPGATFFGFEVNDLPGRRIDYVFVSESTSVTRYGVLTDQLEGRYPSDHLPVVVELRF